MPPDAKLKFTHYRVISRLGGGGMGEVFLAEDTRLLRKTALKILAPEVAGEPGRLARFLQEARAASAFNHPNVAHIYEIGEENGLHFLAMEYVEGRTLEARLSEGAVPIPEVLSVATQVVDALDAAHSRGIVHRDIKPANLMLDPRGHVKVLDFGLAKMIPAATGDETTQFISSSGALLGTVAFMSPEQALGRNVDGRSDLFSLGVVLYQMVTGRLPFAGQTSQETLARILREQPEPVSRFSYDLPPEVERIIRKCLEKDRERRYASARDLLVDLRNINGPAADLVNVVPMGAAPIRTIIVDDEELARQLLREYLETGDGIEVVAECSNGFEALKSIAEHKPGLVFLDVQMPKLDGFEVLDLLGDSVPVIFTTAFDQYAIKAFEAHAVDYLLKPFSEERLWTAVARARERMSRLDATAAPTKPVRSSGELMRDARGPGQYLERVVVRDGAKGLVALSQDGNAKVQIIAARKLDYVEAQDDYIALFSEKKSYLKQQTVSSIEEQLDPKMFVRVHRSYIVNLERIARIEPMAKDSRVVVLTDGTQVPVSRGGYLKLKAALGDGV